MIKFQTLEHEQLILNIMYKWEGGWAMMTTKKRVFWLFPMTPTAYNL